VVNYTSTQNKSLNIPTQVYKKLAFSAVTKGPTLTESTLPIENYKLSQKKGEGLHNFMRKRYIHFSIIHQALKVRHILARRWSPSLDVFLLFKKKSQIFTPEFNTCLQYNTQVWSTFAFSAVKKSKRKETTEFLRVKKRSFTELKFRIHTRHTNSVLHSV